MLAVFFVYVIWPCFGNSAEADEKIRKECAADVNSRYIKIFRDYRVLSFEVELIKLQYSFSFEDYVALGDSFYLIHW